MRHHDRVDRRRVHREHLAVPQAQPLHTLVETGIDQHPRPIGLDQELAARHCAGRTQERQHRRRAHRRAPCRPLAGKIVQRARPPVVRRPVVGDQPPHERLRIVVVEHARTGVLVHTRHELLDHVRDTPGTGQDAHETSFVVRDRELAQRPRPAARDHDDVRRSDVHDLTAHQARTRVDDDVEPVDRRIESLNVLCFRQGRRDPHHEAARSLGSHHSLHRQPRARTRD